MLRLSTPHFKGATVHITIGIRGITSPVSLDVDLTEENIRSTVEHSVQQEMPLELTSTDGEHLIIPARSLGFVKIDKEEQRRVGFGFV